MSNREVQAHPAHVTRRAKPSDELTRRTVFRSVLSNPFHINWPYTPEKTQEDILSCVVRLCHDIANYYSRREETCRMKRKSTGRRRSAKIRKLNLPTQSTSQTEQIHHDLTRTSRDVQPDTDSLADSPPPAALQHLTIGINEVTKRLESHARSLRRASSVISTGKSTVSTPTRAPVRLVLVCYSDLSPPALVAHLPQLIASCNAYTGPTSLPVKLLSLPRGAQSTLSQAIGLRRVAVLAVDADMPGLDSIHNEIESIPLLRAPLPLFTRSSLDSSPSPSMEPTHIKQLRTSAPKDMKLAKELRGRERAEAKRKKAHAKAQARAETKVQPKAKVAEWEHTATARGALRSGLHFGASWASSWE